MSENQSPTCGAPLPLSPPAAIARVACCCGVSIAIRPAGTRARTTGRPSCPPCPVRCSKRSAPTIGRVRASCFAIRGLARSPRRSSGR